MPFIPWTEDLALGIPAIDAQHQQLLALINALHCAITTPDTARTSTAEILEGLVDYTHNHFIMEEVMFQRHGYPQTEAHVAEHSAFTARAMDWLMRFEAGHDVTQEALDFLKDWLLHHICEEDRAYVPFMRAALEMHTTSATH